MYLHQSMLSVVLCGLLFASNIGFAREETSAAFKNMSIQQWGLFPVNSAMTSGSPSVRNAAGHMTL
jgi:hypothetical protein